MPKCYSIQEKEYIRKRLHEEAAKCLAQYGVRRTTVDEIVKRVNIPKGTFYLFYKSKEMLLFEVILEQHECIEQKIYDVISTIDPINCTVEQLTDMICMFFKVADEIPILKVLNSSEIELLARKLPSGVLEEHFAHDTSMIEKVMEQLPMKASIDIEVLSAAFRAIYLTSMHKEEIGTEYDKVLRIMVQGLVMQIF